jgi:hypothetical protein
MCPELPLSSFSGSGGSRKSERLELTGRPDDQVGDPTLADRILDRLVHNAHRMEMRGDSMSKNRGKINA